MKVLLDNCVPRAFGRRLLGHDVVHASAVGMAALANGELLAAAHAKGFEAMVTVDRNLARQQNLSRLPLPVILILSVKNSEPALARHTPAVVTLLGQALARRVHVVGG